MAAVAVLVFTFAFNGGTMSSYIQNLINLAPNRFDVTFDGLGDFFDWLRPEPPADSEFLSLLRISEFFRFI